ncbi:MAG: sensor histidine kinase [Candidatus Saccharimonadales bacterium]
MKGKFGTHEQYVDGGHLGALVAAAHELKTPLALMYHLSNTLDTPEFELTDSERTECVQRLKLTSERMLRLVQHLTVSYRLDNQDQLAFQFELEPLSINEVCENALHELTPYAKGYDQELRLSGQHCPHLVLADRDVLHDIVINLVDNAIRHNPAGSVVDVGSHCRRDQVRLSVHDNGPGVSQQELTSLRRTIGVQPQPLSGRAGSSGLGLYIVGQLAKSMGGNLGLGRAQQGTTFFVDLLRSQQMSLL